MTYNLGTTERVIRGILGVALIGIGWFAHVHVGWRAAAMIIGGISLITSLVAFCPLWAAFGINTCTTPGTRTDLEP